MTDPFWDAARQLADYTEFIDSPVIVGHPSAIPEGLDRAYGFPVYAMRTAPPDTLYIVSVDQAEHMMEEDREWVARLWQQGEDD